MFNLIDDNKVIAQSSDSIVWVEVEMSWLVITEDTRTHYCDPLRKMTVAEVTEP
jgi:hypothetical protein